MFKQLPRMRRTRRGFTLIELLVCLLILSILMAVALPLYLSAVSDSQFHVCRANMQTIANSVQAARVKDVAPDYGPWVGQNVVDLIAAQKLENLNVSPVCPNGAYFAIDIGSSGDSKTFRVKCCPYHGSFEPGYNSN